MIPGLDWLMGRLTKHHREALVETQEALRDYHQLPRVERDGYFRVLAPNLEDWKLLEYHNNTKRTQEGLNNAYHFWRSILFQDGRLRYRRSITDRNAPWVMMYMLLLVTNLHKIKDYEHPRIFKHTYVEVDTDAQTNIQTQSNKHTYTLTCAFWCHDFCYASDCFILTLLYTQNCVKVCETLCLLIKT